MKVCSSEALLRQLQSDTQEILRIAEKDFSSLSPAQLHWHPAPDKWSVAQCLEHLNRFGHHYLPAFRRGIQKGLAQGKTPKTQFTSGWLGAYLVKAVSPLGNPQAVGKMPAPKAYNPARSGQVNPEVLTEFMQQQRELLSILDEARKVDLNTIRIPVSISRLIRLKLGDCLPFVIVHAQRHVQQAQRVQRIFHSE